MRLLISLIQTYAQRRDRSEFGGNDIELKMYLELSLNALYKLVLTLYDGEKISAQDIELIRTDVAILIECAISELFAMYRCRGDSYVTSHVLTVNFSFHTSNTLLL